METIHIFIVKNAKLSSPANNLLALIADSAYFSNESFNLFFSCSSLLNALITLTPVIFYLKITFILSRKR